MQQPKKKPEKQVNVVVTQQEGAEPAYANHAVINHTPHDFTLQFAHVVLPPNLSELEEDGEFVVPSNAAITIPVSLMPLLIDALKKNWEMYQEKERVRNK